MKTLHKKFRNKNMKKITMELAIKILLKFSTESISVVAFISIESIKGVWRHIIFLQISLTIFHFLLFELQLNRN